MAIVVMLDGAPPSAVRVVVSPLAELSAALHALTQDDHAAHGRWRSELGELPGGFREEAARWAPLWSAYRARFFYAGAGAAAEHPGPHAARTGLEDELSALAGGDLDTFRGQVEQACVGGYTSLGATRRTRAADRAAELRRRAQELSDEHADLADRLAADPRAVRAELVAFLGWSREVFFDATWQLVSRALVTEQVLFRHTLSQEGPALALTRLGPRASLRTGPLRVSIDKVHQAVVEPVRTGLVVVPTVIGQPHLLIKREPGHVPVLHYPVAGAAPVPTQTALRRLQALSDPNRLRLCRLIARQPLSTTTLAARCGMSAPQVSRHLRQLRELGLVRTARQGRYVHYSLDLDVVQRVGSDLVGSLLV